MALPIVISSIFWGKKLINFKGEVKVLPGGLVYANQLHHVGGGRVTNIPVGSEIEARTIEITDTLTKDLHDTIKKYWNNGATVLDTISHDGKIYKQCFLSKDCTGTIGSDVTIMWTILDFNA